MAKKFITKIEEKLIEDLLSEKLMSYRPDVRFKEALYQRLFKKVGVGYGFSFGFGGFARWISAGTATLVLVMSLGVTTGYAYLSPNVNSESNLYFMKNSVEKVEYELAFSEEDKIKTLIKFNERREEEIEVLAKQGIEDKVAMKEIEVNLKESIVLLDKIEDVELKKELYVLIEPDLDSAAAKDDGATVGETEDEEGDPEDKPSVIVEDDSEDKDEVGGAGWNLGIILPPAPKMEVSESLLEVEDDFGFESDQGGYFDFGDGMGGGGDVDAEDVEDYQFEDLIEDRPPLILEPISPVLVEPVLPLCKSVCKTGASQLCGDKNSIQYCGDYDKNGCDEWGKCVPVKEEEDDEFFFDPIDEPVITPIKLQPIQLQPIEPVIEPIDDPIITPINPLPNFNFGF